MCKRIIDNFINIYDEDDSVDATTYELSDGRQVSIFEDCMEGMAGEPTYYLVYQIGNELVSFKDIQHLLNEKDLLEIKKLNNNLSDDNYNTALYWVK